MFEKILEILTQQFEYDVWVMSQPFMYILVIPILFYVSFFMLKWAILTLPLWIPIYLIASAFNSLRGNRDNDGQ